MHMAGSAIKTEFPLSRGCTLSLDEHFPLGALTPAERPDPGVMHVYGHSVSSLDALHRIPASCAGGSCPLGCI
jgi:hypothetical protein